MTSETLVDVTIADVLLQAPGAAHVLATRGLSCVGCPFAPFETLADVARIYRLDPMELATALLQATPHVIANAQGLNS
jgi:hybrid cluster-associated redox disulfide protein